jgi:hypothetical protein
LKQVEENMLEASVRDRGIQVNAALSAQEDGPQGKRPFVEPKLTFVEPKLVKHGDIVEVTKAFFGPFYP